MNAGQFWLYVLYAAIAMYFGLALIITIGGWFNLFQMLRRLRGSNDAVADAPIDHSSRS